MEKRPLRPRNLLGEALMVIGGLGGATTSAAVVAKMAEITFRNPSPERYAQLVSGVEQFGPKALLCFAIAGIGLALKGRS